MDAALSVGLLWTLFALAHIGLATVPIRRRLVDRFGEIGFALAYSLIAYLLYAIVVAAYATQRFDGPRGPSLGDFVTIRWVLVAVIATGVSLMTGSFVTYDRSPYAVVGKEAYLPPRGLERITRHPFFVGLTLFSLAHALLATRLVGAVFLAGSGAVAIVGSWHQDRKLRARLGAEFGERLRGTSTIPFAAILAGRQRLVWSELPFKAMALGLLLTLGLRALHDGIFVWAGAPLILSTIGATAVIGVVGLWRSRSRSLARPRGTIPHHDGMRA